MDRLLAEVDGEITLDQFIHTVEFSDNYETSTSMYDISYPGLIMKITLDRVIGYHLLQTYIPSGIFVIFAWLSLFLPLSSVPGRVCMGMITILALTSLFNGVRANMPKVSYFSCIDIWMVMCLFFVICCMFEFVTVVFLIQLGKEKLSIEIEKICRVDFPVIIAKLSSSWLVPVKSNLN